MSLLSTETAIITAANTANHNIESKSIQSSDALSTTTTRTTIVFPFRGPVKPPSSNAISIFNPITVENFATYGKPNAIVRPVVRRYDLTDEMSLPQFHDTNVPVTGQPTANNIKQDSPVKYEKKEVDSFARELDIKLKYLQKDKKTSSKNVKQKNRFSTFQHFLCPL